MPQVIHSKVLSKSTVIRPVALLLMIGGISSCAAYSHDSPLAAERYKACVYDLNCSQAEISKRFDEVLRENGKPPTRKPRYI